MERLHEATRKKIINIETGEIYNSIGDAAKAVNVSGSTMGR